MNGEFVINEHVTVGSGVEIIKRWALVFCFKMALIIIEAKK